MVYGSMGDHFICNITYGSCFLGAQSLGFDSKYVHLPFGKRIDNLKLHVVLEILARKTKLRE